MVWTQINTRSAISAIIPRLILATMMIGVVPINVTAQDPDGATPRAVTPAEDSPEKPRVEVRPDDTVILIDGQTGQAIPVPAGATVEAFVEWLKQREKSRNDGRPDYYVSSVSLDGEVTRESSDDSGKAFARLNVRINIQLLRDEASVRVPLRHNEGTLLKHTHTGPGVPAFLPSEPGQGLTCLLTGAGQHQLDLIVSVPVRESGGTQRIQLSLPGSFRSSLLLIVPGMGITVPNESLNAETQQLPDAKTSIQVDGPGSSLDLSWQARLTPRTVETELQSRTVMSAELGPDGAVIEAAQTVTTTGMIDSLDVELPDGYSFVSVSSSTHQGVLVEDAQANPLRLLFAGSTTGTVQLHWELSLTAPQDDGVILLGQLLLKDALRQENWLGVAVADGHRLERIEAQTRSVLQIPARKFRAQATSQLTQGPINQAWRLQSEDARVAYTVSRMTPSFRVTPSYDLTFRETRAEVAMYIDVRVFSGSLERIPLEWPGLQSESWQQIEVFGWRRAESEDPELVNIIVQTVDQQTGHVELLLEGSQTSTQGLLQIELHSSRPIQADGTPFSLSIPGVDVLPIPIGELTVHNAASIESVLEVGQETTARLSTSNKDRVRPIRLPENQRQRSWELNSTRLEFTATATVHDQSIACDSIVNLSIARDRVTVEQILDYAVSYAPLSAARVVLPVPMIVAQDAVYVLRFAGESDDADLILSPEPNGLGDESGRQFRLTLPDDVWGDFQIITTWSLPLNDELDGDLSIVVPLVQSSDASPSVTRLTIDRPSSINVRVGDAVWKNELAPGRSDTWVAAVAPPVAPPRVVPLDLRVSVEQAAERFAVRRAALQSRVHPSGIQMDAVYHVAGEPGRLDIRLPLETDLRSLSVWWDGNLVDAESVTRTDDADGGIRVNLSGQPDGLEHVLALRFQTVVSDDGSAASLDVTLLAPQFASDVWLAETLWTVTLPLSHHVFIYPGNYAPRFQWARSGLFWTRQTPQVETSTADWFFGNRSDDASADGEQIDSLRAALRQLPLDPLSPVADSNSYLFSAFGHQNRLRFRTLSHPAIALLGTGISLIVGLILMRIPATRHVLSFVVLAFGMALAGLWRLEAVQLLIQPALLGLCLAGIASVIDGWRKREMSPKG